MVGLKYPSDKVLAAKIRNLFEELAAGPYRGLFRLVLDDEIAKLGAYPNATFFIEPAVGYRAQSGVRDDRFVVLSIVQGDHGYLPSETGIHTGLIMAGAGIKDGAVLSII